MTPHWLTWRRAATQNNILSKASLLTCTCLHPCRVAYHKSPTSKKHNENDAPSKVIVLECLPHRLRRIRYQLPILYSTAGSQLTGNSCYHHLQESTNTSNTRPLRKDFWHAPSQSTQGANHGCQLAIPRQVHMQYQGNIVIWQEIDRSAQNCKLHAESLRSEWCCHDAVMML